MTTPAGKLPTLELIVKTDHHSNAPALRNALLDYHRHVARGGKVFWAVPVAMSTAPFGIRLAPATRVGLIHGLSVTGANLEETLFRPVAHSRYANFFDYRDVRGEDDEAILNL